MLGGGCRSGGCCGGGCGEVSVVRCWCRRGGCECGKVGLGVGRWCESGCGS